VRGTSHGETAHVCDAIQTVSPLLLRQAGRG